MRKILALTFAFLPQTLLAATYTVTNTADAGAGSLRQAILDANGTPAVADTIAFNIPGAGVHTITPSTALPTLTDAVTVDGYTQPGSSANTNGPGLPDNSVHRIELNGMNSYGGTFGGALILQGSFAFTLRGLVINRAPGAGVQIISANGVIAGSFIGVDPTGLVPLPNVRLGISADSTGVMLIGGVLPAERNIISGNGYAIGFGCTSGVGGSGHFIQGNFVGTDATGSADAGNGSGISLCYAVTNVTIGGATPAARNVISGNNGSGINISSSFCGACVTGTLVQGNYIGTDVTGTLPLGNGGIGIGINTVGNDVLDNVIGANTGDGIVINSGNPADGAVIQGNRIGTDASGLLPLGNAGAGVHIVGSGAMIGGTGAGEPNVIAFNGTSNFSGHGVWVENGTGGSIRHNSIHDNFGLGVALGTDGTTPNDPGDADTGPNNVQNFPVLSTLTPTAPTVESPEGGLRIQGVLHSTLSTTYDLDFFSNPACVKFPKDFLEGAKYLGSGVVTTDGSGTGVVDVTVPIGIVVGEQVSATATDPSGNTSEFSQRLPFSVNPASGDAAGSTALTVSGTDFGAGATVTIGGQAATGIVIGSSTSLTAMTPALPAGSSNDLVVTNTDATTGALVKGWVADFLDVPAAQQFHSFVTTLVSNAITAGVGGGLYGVNDDTLRQQMAVFLLKAKYGLCYAPSPCTGVFPDVSCPSTFAAWIEALAAEGITGGCGGGNYCPANPVRRDQMAVFLLKAKYGSSYTPPNCTGVFLDVPCPGTFTNWIEQLAAEAITGGCGGGNYCPLNNNTRGQMAVFIVKTFNLQ